VLGHTEDITGVVASTLWQTEDAHTKRQASCFYSSEKVGRGTPQRFQERLWAPSLSHQQAPCVPARVHNHGLRSNLL
jgi:hypothetical protein